MQNVDPQKPGNTDDEHLDLDKGPKSLSNVPDSIESRIATTQEGTLSEPETLAKAKTRSRFSSALRKLSKSTRKKSKIAAKETATAPTTEGEITSGGEDALELNIPSTSADIKEKKKSKLSKRFLLTTLRKSKKSLDEDATSPKSDSVEQQEEAKSEEIKATPHLQSAEGAESTVLDAETAINISAQRLDRISKVQITISGKKIEQLPDTVTTTEIAGSPSETDYLTPTEDISPLAKELSTSTTTSPSKSDTAKAKKKKLKSKKTVASVDNINSPSQTQTKANVPTAKAQSTKTTTTTKTTTSTNEEKFVITKSTRDTPPPEQAPAKPTRIAVTLTSQTVNSSETTRLRKPTTRAAATHTSPHRFQDSTETGTSAPTTEGSSKQSRTTGQQQLEAAGLMRSTQGTTQRGHRFPKPPASAQQPTRNIIQSTSPIVTATKIPTPTSNPVASTEQQQRQRQIKFQSQSHASKASQSLPPSPPDEQQQPQSLQSIASNDLLLQLPSYPPPPIPSTVNLTPETQSPAHRHPPLSPIEANIAEVNQLDHNIQLATTSVGTLTPDEVVSSAESAQPSEYSGNNLDRNNDPDSVVPQEQSTSQDSQATVRTDLSTEPHQIVHFAVGSTVRPYYIHADTLQEQVSYESKTSDDEEPLDSPSPVSETSRKRIRYIAQPTLFDELNSLERRRVAFKYQGGVSPYSLDSEEDSGENQMPAFGDLTMDQDMEPTIMTTTTTEKSEHLYKILVIGELGTGKTSFIKRYVHQFFSQNYRATIGVDFALKVLHWDENTVVRLQLWDIAGQERFGTMTRVYYKESVGAFIVFDVTRSGTFDCVAKWKEDLDSKVQLPDGSPIPCILLANKCDQEKQGMVTSTEKMDEYVRENGFAGWFETSAKENINIDAAARALVSKILLNDKLINAADLADSEKFNLSNSGDQSEAESKSKCSC